jgi:hypothetical protein
LYVEKSFYLFSKDNPLRRFALSLVTSIVFEWFILSLVLLNAATLAIDTTNKPGYASSYTAFVLGRLDIAIIVIFTAETVLKMIAFGVFLGPNTYFKDGEPRASEAQSTSGISKAPLSMCLASRLFVLLQRLHARWLLQSSSTHAALLRFLPVQI